MVSASFENLAMRSNVVARDHLRWDLARMNPGILPLNSPARMDRQEVNLKSIHGQDRPRESPCRNTDEHSTPNGR